MPTGVAEERQRVEEDRRKQGLSPESPKLMNLIVLQNFAPMNRWTVKLVYPTPRIEQIGNNILKLRRRSSFGTDASNSSRLSF